MKTILPFVLFFIFISNAKGSHPGTIIEKITVVKSITTLPVSTLICSGNSITVSYTITGTFNSGNIFTAQLSNASGSFASPVPIGSLISTVAGTINAVIPSNMASGNGYRIRVLSNSPSVTGSNNGTNISINTTPTLTTSSNPGAICSGSSSTLCATGANTYTWNPGALTGSAIIISPTITTIYTVTGKTSSGCTSQKATTLNVNSSPSLTVSTGPQTICAGASSTLNASGASTYTWNPGNLNGSVITISPTITTIYTVSGKNTAGCSSQKTTTIYVNSIPSLTITTNPQTICAGVSSTLIAGGANSYTWNPGAITGSAITISPGITTIYTVTGTNNSGCTGYKTTTVSVNSSPSLTVTANSQTICAGSTSTLTAGGANTYTWNPGSFTGSTIVISPTTATIYTITALSSSGCAASQTLNLSVNHSNSSTSTITACNSFVWNTNTYTTSGVYSYTSQNISGCDSVAILNLTINHSNSSTSIITACNSFVWNTNTYTTSGVYSYTSQNISGCDSVAILNLTINHSNSSTSTTTACNSFVWNANTYTTSGVYSYTSQNISGCDSVAILNLTINPNPTLTLSPTGTATFCPGSFLTLSGPSGMSSYLWSNGASTKTINVSIEENYSLQITDSNGCSSTSAFVQVLNGLPSDFDENRTVNIDDFIIFAPSFGQSCSCSEDLDHDGDVDIDDFILFAPTFGLSCE